MLRGYDCYLDGHFIDGEYSHGAIYVGNDTIIHAISPTVCRTHVIDFMECDRIVILRPSKGMDEAVEKAQKFADEKVPYDFFFDAESSDRLYCFELVAECYKSLDFKKFEVKKLFGLITKEVYLSKSFIESENVEMIYECNPRTNRFFKNR